MPKIPSKDYIKDRDVFLRDLKQFNDSKGISNKTPVVNGVEIDLFQFYSLVQQRGGLSKVIQTDAWDSFLRPLRLPHPCVNGTTLLRKLYGTHLEKYERAKGPPGRDDDNDMDDDPRRSSRSGLARSSHSTHTHGAYISASGETLKTGVRPIAGPSERLALSLLSPMPNEQDFAVNVCTVLAADYANRLPIGATPHILDFLLAHAGVYNHSSLRETIGRSYYEARGRYPHEFWSLRSGGGGAKELADESKFSCLDLDQPDLMVQALAAQNNLTDALLKDGTEVQEINVEDLFEDWVVDPSEDDQLFAPELPGGAKCVFTQRVLQVASIVRSLSFHEENLQILAKNTTCIRFLLLCANCWVGTLRQSGLDTLGNVCAELIIKDPATCLISRHVLSTIQSAIMSEDRARMLAALEMLNKLAQNENNEDALLKAIEPKIYTSICALLTLRDIMLLVCALECVYAVSSLGERSAECVAKVPGLVHTLVSLVTVEAQSYGPRACILMRVVETVSGTAAAAAAESNEKPAVKPPAPSPVKTFSAPEPKTTVQNATPVAATPVVTNNVHVQHMQQKTVQENEQFAIAWLKASFEPLPSSDNSAFSPSELYRQYVACCSKLQRKGVIAPNHFPRLVRSVFGGTVGPSTVTLSTGETQQMYIGIRSKTQQPKPQQNAGPASPILKAQLTTNKAGEVSKTVIQTTAQAQQGNHPHLSQALETTSNTSLIKHLLAHKVSPASQMQVAQRQQSQHKFVAATTNNVIVQPNPSAMEVDPEALIKCTTILPGGVSATQNAGEKLLIPPLEDLSAKDEPVQFQIDDQSQFSIQKSSQNKMLADLLEKKSNPPIQVMTMGQVNAPTIQITETGQIVQVKQDNVVHMGDQAIYYKADPNQLIQVKNEQGQIIHMKPDQLNQIIQLKNEKEHQMTKNEVNEIEPPTKKAKVEDSVEEAPQESVSKTAANLYAALAASALEDEEDLMPPKEEPPVQQSVIVSGNSDNPVMIQEPILQVQQPTLQVQQPTIQVQQPLQVQQPMLQVSGLEMSGLMAQPFLQQPMQIIATPNSTQGGISYLAQNIPNNMMQKTIIIVQGATSGGPITLTVNNPGGLDEATLNSVIAQATEAITQQQLIQNSGVIQSTQRVIVSQCQPTIVSSSISKNPPQLTASQQPIITTQPQPLKAQIITQQPQIVTQPLVIQKQQMLNQQNSIVNGSQQVIQSGQVIQGGQQVIQSGQQVIQGGQQVIQSGQQLITVPSNQQIIMNSSKNMHRVVQRTDVKPALSNSTTPVQQLNRQVVNRQPVMVGGTKIGDKELIVNTPPDANQAVTTKTVTPPPQEDTPWTCHWKGCGKTFNSASSVFRHCASVHCPTSSSGEASCQWMDCDQLPRKPFALLNHLNDRHCTAEALKQIYNSKKASTAESDSSKSSSVSYPPNAAMAALNKHAVEFLNPRELMQRADPNRTSVQTDENEGPVTKSIRLTAALILRNLVIYSNTGRRYYIGILFHMAPQRRRICRRGVKIHLESPPPLRCHVYLRTYEAHLATIALSNVEASRTIAQVLYDMNNI